MTNVRHAMLTRARQRDSGPDGHLLDLCCAWRRQCFVNEYVFALTEDENEQAHAVARRDRRRVAGNESRYPRSSLPWSAPIFRCTV